MAGELHRRLAAVPLAMPGVAAACAVAAVDGGLWGWWCGVAAAVWAAGWSDRWRGLCLAVLAAAVAGGAHGWRVAADSGRLERVFARGERVTMRLRGEVTTVPVVRGNRWTAMVRATGSEGGGSSAAEVTGMKVWWSGASRVPLAGASVEASGLLERPPVRRNPGEFDFAGWLWRQRVGMVFSPLPGKGTVVIDPTGWRGRAERFRRGFAEAIILGLDAGTREARVILAMVVGVMPEGDDELIGAFRESGVLHVFAVSGLHVGIVAAIGWVVLRCLRVPRRMAIGLLLALVFGYAWVVGWKATTMRAAWMVVVALTGFLLRRPAALLNSLTIVGLAALLLDGHQLFLPGFQLSYGVVAVIGIFGVSLGRLCRRFAGHDPFLPRSLLTTWQERRLRWREGTLSSLGVSLAAWLGSAPLIGWHFGLLTPVAPLASLVLMPVVFVILGLALLGAALAPVAPWAACQVNRLNAVAADVSVFLAGGAAALPGACVPLAALVPSPRELVIHDIPHGGGAAVLRPGGRGAVLFDTGDGVSFERVVLPALRQRATTVDDLMLSHPDSGHIGGAAVALDALRPRRVWLPVERARSPAYRALVAEAPHDGREVRVLERGGGFACGPTARWEVVRVADPAAWDAVADDRCAVLRLHWCGWRILFTGDAGFVTEKALLDQGADVAAEVWVAGRHRTDPGFTAEFLAAVAPRLVVASHAEFPPEERLPADWRARLDGGGIAWFHQGESGAVTIRAEQGHLSAEGFVDGKRVELNQPVAK